MWLDCRTGNSTYLMFFLVFLNFILISYTYLIEGSQIFEKVFLDLRIFIIIFLVFYFPIAIIIGRWHVTTQIGVEQDILRSEEPIFAKMVRALLDVQTGKASEEEIKEFRKFLNEIEKNDIKDI